MTLKTAIELQKTKDMVWELLSEAMSKEYRSQREWLEENRPFRYDEHDADDVVCVGDKKAYYTETAIENSVADSTEEHPEVAAALEIILRAIVEGPYCDYETIQRAFLDARKVAQNKEGIKEKF